MQRTQKKKRKNPITAGLFNLGLILLTGFFVMGIVQEFQTYFNLKSEVRANQVLRDETIQLQQTLENEKKNLTNPDYLEFVARGKYHVSRSGEQVFVFPSLSQGTDTNGNLNDTLPDPNDQSTSSTTTDNNAPAQGTDQTAPEGEGAEPVEDPNVEAAPDAAAQQ